MRCRLASFGGFQVGKIVSIIQKKWDEDVEFAAPFWDDP